MAGPYLITSLVSVVIVLAMISFQEASYMFLWSDELDCQEGDTELIHYSYMIPWGVPDRALKTTPPHISIQASSIPDTGLGAFAKTFLKKGTWLGEYEGLSVPLEQKGSIDDWSFTFKVYRGGEPHHYVDAIHLATSSWIRYINGGRHPGETNVEEYQCYDKIFTILSRDVAPGTELLINYGPEYYKTFLRGIDASVFD